MGFRPDIFIEEPNKKVKGEKGFLPSIVEYSSLEYNQLKFNLSYAQNDEIFNNDTIHVHVREYNHTLFKFILSESISDLAKFDYSNDKLKNYADNRTLEHFNSKSFELEHQVTVIILNDTTSNIELVKRFCFLNSFETDKTYQNCFRFDNNKNIVYGYKRLRDYTKMYRLYKTAIKFDLAFDSFGEVKD